MEVGLGIRPEVPAVPRGNARFVVAAGDFVPAYVKTHAEGRLRRKAELARAMLRSCTVCPHGCQVNRLAGEMGVCQTGRQVSVSGAFPHLGEEECLRGWRGSGTIFFCGCNLRCVFCQNAEISQQGGGDLVTAEQLTGRMLALQNAGCHNINLVTPSHVVPQIFEALVIAVEQGLRLPLVYNTNGYDSLESLRLLDGVVDIYMPDFKFWHAQHCQCYLTAPDYAEAARAALRAMHEQVGVLRVDEQGLALRGVLVRHLVMPGLLDDTREILHWLATELSPDTYVNVMDQYHPAWKVQTNLAFAGINRRLRREEFEAALEIARQAGLWRFDQPRRETAC